MIKNLYIIVIKILAELLSPLPTAIEQKKWEKRNIILKILGINIGKNVRIGPRFKTINGLEKNIEIGNYTDIGYDNKFYAFDDKYRKYIASKSEDVKKKYKKK